MYLLTVEDSTLIGSGQVCWKYLFCLQ